MPQLEIQHRNGTVEHVDLPTDKPVVLGSSLSSDIFLDSPGVAGTHCQIQWNGTGLEVRAATPAGVLFNGKAVAQATLHHGEMFRAGEATIVLLATVPKPTARAPSHSIELKPVSGDAPAAGFAVSPGAKPSAQPAKPVEPRPMRPAPPPAEASAEDEFADLYREPAEEAGGQLEWLDEALEEDDNAGSGQEGALEEFLDEAEVQETAPQKILLSRLGNAATTGASKTAKAEGDSVAATVRSAFQGPSVRRSQRDPLRSPIVMIMGGTLLVLLLLTGTIYFLVERQKAQAEFEHGKGLHAAKNFPEAIKALDEFALQHPEHHEADAARVMAATDRVDQHLAGTTPNWEKSLEELNLFMTTFSNQASFRKPDSTLRKFVVETSLRIAIGSAQSAKTSHRRPLLDVSDAAIRLYQSNVGEDDPSRTARLDEVQKLRQDGELSILQHEAFLAAAAEIDKALAGKHPLTAADVYRRLLARFASFSTFKPLQDRLYKLLDLEKQLVVRQTEPKAAQTEDRPSPTAVPPLSFNRRTRTRSDEFSIGATCFALAADCLYGVDTITGDPVWRRVIGLDTPFFPVRVAGSVSSLLLFDTRYNELTLIEERSARLIWRLPLPDRVIGNPLVAEGQIYVSSLGGGLYQVDLGTGKLMSQLKFTQGVSGGPVLSDSGERLYLAGRDAVLYVLTRRPLGCERVVYVGHGPGAVVAPLLMMKSFLLLCDNDQLDSCRLRLLDTTRETATPTEIASVRVTGHVHSPPILRGKQLFVPSNPERVTAFTVSEAADSSSLVEVAQHSVKGGTPGPFFLSAGPDDQLWGVSSALRKFQLMKETLRPDAKSLALGLASQPLQMSGESIFVGRHPLYARGVFLAEADRNSMTGQWQVALGGKVLEAAPTGTNGSFVCVTSLGDIYQVSAERLAKGGFEIQGAGTLGPLDDVAEPLSAFQFPDGQLVVRGGRPPRLWFIAGDGSVAREFKTPDVLQVDPLLLSAGIVLPLPGKLMLVNKTTGLKAGEDLVISLGQNQASARWTSITQVDDTQFMALNDAGRVSRVQLRSSPTTHLAEVSHWDAGMPLKIRLAVGGGRVILADNQPRLVALDASSLEPQGEQPLSAPAAQAPWLVGDRVFVDVGGQHFACYDAASNLKKLWEVPLHGVSIGGPPLVMGEGLLVILQDGRIWKLDPNTGEIAEGGTFDLRERVAFGPRRIGNALLVGTLNGSLYSLSAVFQKGN